MLTEIEWIVGHIERLESNKTFKSVMGHHLADFEELLDLAERVKKLQKRLALLPSSE